MARQDIRLDPTVHDRLRALLRFTRGARALALRRIAAVLLLLLAFALALLPRPAETRTTRLAEQHVDLVTTLTRSCLKSGDGEQSCRPLAVLTERRLHQRERVCGTIPSAGSRKDAAGHSTGASTATLRRVPVTRWSPIDPARHPSGTPPGNNTPGKGA